MTWTTTNQSLLSLLCGALAILTASCGRLVTECGGTPLNTERLSLIENAAFQSNSKAFLITPNPLDATGNLSVQSLDSSLGSILDPFSLIGLNTSRFLENSFLKVRINSRADGYEQLATPNSQGEFRFQVSDVHYGESMAYHSLTAIQTYVEELGFQTDRTRPLYVMVKAEGTTTDPNDVNAYYDHHRFNPELPRELKLFGETPHAPRQDRDIYWHEFGHYFLESITLARGIDNSGDLGAAFSEGAAIHECLADYTAESLSGRGYIGRWIAKNFPNDFPNGAPLRTAEDKSDGFDLYNKVNQFESTGGNLDRYRLAEWCSRVLWDIRSQMVNENSDEGRFYADRAILGAASFLKKDTSLSDLKSALLVADEELNCGIHKRSIATAFSSRGYPSEIPQLSQPLTLRASLIWRNNQPGQFSLSFVISNPNSDSAKNVRLVLEPLDARITTVIPQQGYGDLGASKSITVGQNGALPIEYSVQGWVNTDQNYRGARFIIRVQIENGPETVLQGAL
jgi:hypothetical protein